MKKTYSILPVLFILIFLLIFISSIFFIFQKYSPLTKTVKKQFDPLPYLIDEKTNGSFFYGQAILNEIAQLKQCPESVYCIQINNEKNSWLGATNPSRPVVISDKFLIKLALKSTNNAGISLVGRLGKDTSKWWLGRTSLNFYSEKGNIVINADTGITPSTVLISNKKIATDKDGYHQIILITDKYGSNIQIYDNKGILIKNIQSSKILTKNFPEGFFPESRIFLGVSLEASSMLLIREFYGYPLYNQYVGN